MEEILLLIFVVIIVILIAAVVLPIVALVVSIQTKNNVTRQIWNLQARLSAPTSAQQAPPAAGGLPVPTSTELLETRIERLEAALAGRSIPFPEAERKPAPEPPTKAPVSVPIAETSPKAPPLLEDAPAFPPPGSQSPPTPTLSSRPFTGMRADQIESIIGRRWVGWAAVCLILFATAFFLKYAFDNRWIGELGRVTIGVVAGLSMCLVGFRYHKRGWRVFSQILTAGGIVVLYLSVYAAFGYYHLATQRATFIYLGILIAEAAALAYLYNAPAIAIMALIGGFLNPILLHSDRDQYRSLFSYIAALDVGALALLKQWWGLSSLAFAGTHLLFWLWYGERYHPNKLGAVMVFQTGVFLIFLMAHIGRQLLRQRPATFEDLGLMLINPFVFFATAYHLLDPNYHDWMGVFALSMALLYAGAAKFLMDRQASLSSESLLVIGVALSFVTIAIPIQLRSNWITIAWSVEALVMLWAGIEIRVFWLRILGHALFALAILKLILWDSLRWRGEFTPVLNKYFLCSLIVTGCLFGAAFVYSKLAPRRQIAEQGLWLTLLLLAVGTLWLVMSVETYTFFAAKAAAQKVFEDAAHQRWVGQMALSVLWSVYAGALAAIGFVRRSAALRWAALGLFALTTIKAMLVDIAQLQQIYRIVVFFVLGLLLLVVAWGYHKAFHSASSGRLF